MDTLVGPIPCVGFFVACSIASIYFRESNYETPVIVKGTWKQEMAATVIRKTIHRGRVSETQFKISRNCQHFT